MRGRNHTILTSHTHDIMRLASAPAPCSASSVPSESIGAIGDLSGVDVGVELWERFMAMAMSVGIVAPRVCGSGRALRFGGRISSAGMLGASLRCEHKPDVRRGGLNAMCAASDACVQEGQPPVPLMRSLLSAMVRPYLVKNPTAVAALDLIRRHDGGPVCYDHFAFRTFGVDGCGIDAMAQVFLDLGYKVRDELHFPTKKLRALWFSPPDHLLDMEGAEADGPLPRIFISEILVSELSREAQDIIKRYTSRFGPVSKHAATASVLNSLTWPTPHLSDYQTLAKESEYAAWTLVNGYALNHATVSVHRLGSLRNIGKLNDFLQVNGIKLNSEGGILKVSPDGGLQQSSSVADTVTFTFAGGEAEQVPASYIEFAERLILPIHSDLRTDQIHEWHRRDGFEVGNADKIFESTSSDQTGMRKC